MPVPALISPPAPPAPTPPARVTLLAPTSSVAGPLNVTVRAEMSAVLPVPHCSPPPASVIPPEPKLPSPAKLTVPWLIVVTPE